MKDIYEIFNNIKIDENELIEMEVDELEVARVKKRLKESTKRGKSSKGGKRSVAIAAVIAIITVTLGTTLSPYAKQIPIIGDIFKAMENSIYENYKGGSSEIGVTEESKGIKITVNDAVFDGTTISLTYTIESEKDLGDNIRLRSSIEAKGYDKSGSTISSDFKKINDTTYVGQQNMHIFDLAKNPEKYLDCKVLVYSIVNTDTMTEINGRWKFNMTLDAVEGEDILINKSVESQGITAIIDRVTIYPMSTNIAFSQVVSEAVKAKYDSIITDLEIKDDLGNIYLMEGHGSTGDNNFNLSSSATIEKIKEEATKLIITPKVILKELSDVKYVEQESKDGSTGETSINKAETYECKELKEVILDDIIIDLKR